MSEKIVVRKAQAEDVQDIARINSAVFTGNRDNLSAAVTWVKGNFEYVHYHYYVVEFEGVFAGYIGWQLHGGLLRPTPAIELEQLGIDPQFQAQGLASELVNRSIEMIIEIVKTQNTRIESKIIFLVWCYAHNLKAINVYKKFFPEQSGERSQYGGRSELMFRRDENLVLE